MKVGIFSDEPNLGTGFSVVCRYFAEYLDKKSDLEVIYFGRWGQEKYFKRTPRKTDFPYKYVPCQGGTWNKKLVDAIIKRYKIDALLTIDDWWSIDGLLYATKSHKIPFHFMTPLDSLPIPLEAYEKFRQVDALYIPNRSWKIIKTREKEKVNVKYLPYGCDTKIFKPIPSLKNDKFTFVWIGRDEPRKNLRSAILAFEKMCNKFDVELLIRMDWRIPTAIRTEIYLGKKNLPIIQEKLTRCPHGELAKTYNRGHVLLCTTKASGFELQPIEAMACEIPALVTDWNFMNEHIIDGKNGFKVPYDNLETVSFNRVWANIDVEKLANYMELFLKDNRKTVARMGQWARKYIQQNYKWSDSAKVLYESIISN